MEEFSDEVYSERYDFYKKKLEDLVPADNAPEEAKDAFFNVLEDLYYRL